MKHISNVNRKISYSCLNFVLYNKLGNYEGNLKRCPWYSVWIFNLRVAQNSVFPSTRRVNLTNPNNFNASKVYTTNKETNKNLRVNIS
jgi:hypothetical protein